MKTRNKEILIVERSETVDVNEVRFMDTGDTSIIWQIMAAGVFPEWVLEYLNQSAKKIVDLPSSGKQFPEAVLQALAMREEHFTGGS